MMVAMGDARVREPTRCNQTKEPAKLDKVHSCDFRTQGVIYCACVATKRATRLAPNSTLDSTSESPKP